MISKKMEKNVAGSSTIRSMFAEAKEMAAKVGAENVFDFSIGNPNVPAPKEVNEAIKAVVDEVDSVYLHGYMDNCGYPETRQAVADSINRRFGTSYSGKNVVMTAGAASAINIVLKTIMDPGDEIITFKPYFMEYGKYVDNYDGVLVAVATDPKTFLPDLTAFEKSITPKTKGVIINTPHNPTGVIYDEKVLKGLATVLEKKSKEIGHPILLISDEPYRELCYDGYTQPWVAGFYDNTVVCYSFSKSLSLPGERVAYVLVPDTVDECDKFVACLGIANRITGIMNTTGLMQKTLERCIDCDITENIAKYDTNRKLLYKILTDCGFTSTYPMGAFYLWIKTPEGFSDDEFCALCKKHYLLLVPGKSFDGEGNMRAAYCVSEKTIRDSEKAWKAIAKECGL